MTGFSLESNIKTSALLSLALLVGSWISCSSSDFSGGNVSSKGAQRGGDPTATSPETEEAPPTATSPETEETPIDTSPGTEEPLDTEELPISTSTATDTVSPECLVSVLPLRVMLVLDVSSSMENQIDIVKSSLVEFGSRLKAITPLDATQPISDLQVGLISFIDAPKAKFPLTADLDSLSQQIASLTSDNDPSNTDMPEGGLAAVAQALSDLEKEVAGKNVITAVVIVTDDFAHDGTGGPASRVFTSAALDQLLSSKAFDYLRIFDASPQTVLPWGNQGSKTPSDQWNSIRENWRKTRNGTTAIAGAALGFPPSSQTLLEQVPAELQRSLKVCK